MKRANSHYILEPEVAGGLGKNTAIDRTVHPPRVSRLHYNFDGWLGDVLLEAFPCFIITEAAKEKIEEKQLTGAQFDRAEVTVSELFNEIYPGRRLPKFVWLRVEGTNGENDFGVIPDGRLVVSQRALDTLRTLGIANATVTEV